MHQSFNFIPSVWGFCEGFNSYYNLIYSSKIFLWELCGEWAGGGALSDNNLAYK